MHLRMEGNDVLVEGTEEKTGATAESSKAKKGSGVGGPAASNASASQTQAQANTNDTTNEETIRNPTPNKAESGNTETASSSGDNGGSDSNPSSVTGQSKDKPKKDRSTLRKGKWTVEEEEYTSRIIHYFNTGLLNLPDGATLRSYLADKLNCDPMRITKKYAGAACLGRRAQHYRDRAHPTVTEIQLARAELDHLERRFRLRIEEGHSSVPLPPRTDLLLSLAQQNNRMMVPGGAGDNTQALFQTWLLGMSSQQPAVPPASLTPPPVAGQAPWLLPNASANPLQQANPIQTSNFMQPPWGQPPMPPAPGVDAAMANLAFAQAAASLAPAITQLAAENLRQQQQQQQLQQQLQQRLKDSSSAEAIQEYTRQLQQSFEQQATAKAPPTAAAAPKVEAKPPVEASVSAPSASDYAKQLKKSFERAASVTETPSSTSNPSQGKGNTVPALIVPEGEVQKPHPATSKKSSQQPTAVAHANQSKKTNRAQKVAGPISAKANSKQSAAGAPKSHKDDRKPPQRRSEEDKQAGAVLIGFLSSLRTSYEEALKEKEKGVTITTLSGGSTPIAPEAFGGPSATASETASVRQVTDNPSSVEDSDWSANKKTDPSSSEESDKEQHQQKQKQQKRSWGTKGPPRKRLKTQRATSNESSHRSPSA